MTGKDSGIRQAARLLRRCGTLGIRPALRGVREEARIRREREQPGLLTEKEREAQRRKTFPGRSALTCSF